MDVKYLSPSHHHTAEPMTLGSPVNSPHSGPPNQNFLPGFLLGSAENPTSSSTSGHGSSGLSSYLPGYLMGDGIPNPVSSKIHRQSSFNRHGGNVGNQPVVRSASLLTHLEHSPRQPGVTNHQKAERLRRQAPPTMSLWASVTSPPSANQHQAVKPLNDPPIKHSTPTINSNHRSVHFDGRFVSPSVPPTGTPNHLNMFKEPSKTFFSPAQVDPFYTQGESLKQDSLDETWVTIFGYPPATASYILQQFVQYGTVEKHVIANEGNWMHLKYQTKLQAKKALSKNGKIFGSNIMVGVQPCIDTKVMQLHNKSGEFNHSADLSVPVPQFNSNNSSNIFHDNILNTPKQGLVPPTPGANMPGWGASNSTPGGPLLNSGLSPVAPAVSCDVSALNSSQMNTSRINGSSSMRPLAASHRQENAVIDSMNESHNNSLLSKAVNYVFGWS